jgi:hypothetical protein
MARFARDNLGDLGVRRVESVFLRGSAPPRAKKEIHPLAEEKK